MNKIVKELIILLGVVALIWIGIAKIDSFPNKPKIISKETEEKLGETYLEAVLNNPQFQECTNEYINNTIDSICQLMANAIEEPLYTYNYFVVNNSMVNAFTLPGGNIVITTGLIKYCKSADELAGVVAHEFGHAQEQHIISRLVKELGINIITSGDTFVLGEVTKEITSSSFDRKQEEKADNFACGLLYKANLEPRILARLFRRLKEDNKNNVLKNFEIIASHPNFNSRIKKILAYKVDENFKADTIKINWNQVTTELEKPEKEIE